MRLRCSGHSRLNETLLELSVARYNRTGMATIPKLMTPFQIDRGMPYHLTGRFPLCARPSRANSNGPVNGAHAACRGGRPTRRAEGAVQALPGRRANARE